MKNNLLLSFIVPTYNRSNYLKRCLDSILSQEVDCYEIIVSDNASPDNTQEIMQNYIKYPQVHYFRNEVNVGARENIYKATGSAQGEYIFWLSDDDYLLPNALSKVMDVIHTHPKAGYIYSPVVTIDERNGQISCRRDDFQESKLVDFSLKHFPTVMSSAWVFSRQILKKELIDWHLWEQHKDNAYFMLIIVGNILLHYSAYYISDDLVHHTWFNVIYWEEYGIDNLSIQLVTATDYSQCMKIVLSNYKNKLVKYKLILCWERKNLLSMLNSNNEIANSFKSIGRAKTIQLILAKFQYNPSTALWLMEYLLVSSVNQLKYMLKKIIPSSILDFLRQWRVNGHT